MAVNRDNTGIWKADVAKSVDFYNNWFMSFAPKAFRKTRIETTKKVEHALRFTKNLTDICPELLLENPLILPMLRMATCPPIACDRLIGLAGISPHLVKCMEKGEIPPRMNRLDLMEELTKIGHVIEKMADPDIFVWKARGDQGTNEEIYRASTIVADRLCGAETNPIIRNAQEARQIVAIKNWFTTHGYQELRSRDIKDIKLMPPGSFVFHHNVPGILEDGKKINIAVDVIIQKKDSLQGDFPALIEAKSAGDFANTNKRRKEEAQKIQQLRRAHGMHITFDLFLCGYFDTPYLGYEAAEGIDWVWEHRIDDFTKFGF